MLENRGLTLHMAHIKDHQDDQYHFYQLDRWAQLNVLADQKAKLRLQQHIVNGREALLLTFHGEGWSCWLGAMKCEERLYWSFNQRISYKQFDAID